MRPDVPPDWEDAWEEEWDGEEQGPQTPKEWLWWYGKRGLAVLALVGLLFLSGIYQGTFFHRTPERTQEPLPARVDENVLVLPLRLIVFTSDGDLSSERTRENVEQLVENASALWQQASLTLSVDVITFTEVGSDTVASFLEYPPELLDTYGDSTYGGVTVFLVEELSGLNGIAFTGSRTVAVADFTTELDYRVLAHEIGHILGLRHTRDSSDLMYSGSNGFNLSLEEIARARSAVLR